MLELVRGYATATLDAAGRDGESDAVASDLAAIALLLVSSEPLREALSDPTIPAVQREAVLEDLLGGKVAPAALAMVTFSVHVERPSDTLKSVEQLVQLAEQDAARLRVGGPLEPDSPLGRSGTFERLRGYAERQFEELASPEEVDDVEDELFGLARVAQGSPELRAAFSDPLLPLPNRLAVLNDLIAGKVKPPTLWLTSYVLRAGRVRDLTGALDYLVELAAAERGRRVAEVRAAVELSTAEQERLAVALRRIVRRPVELRVQIDASVIGGIEVQVGDTIIDGTVRHRLERLSETLLQTA